MLGKSEALTDINQNPYQNYGGQRIAEFNPTQQNAFQEAINRQAAGQLAPATNLATSAGLGSRSTYQGQRKGYPGFAVFDQQARQEPFGLRE
jgi:hypothetical protein